MASQNNDSVQGLTPQEYTQYMKERAVRDFVIRLVNYAKGRRHHYLDRNIKMLIVELESIDNADFEGGRYDEPPF